MRQLDWISQRQLQDGDAEFHPFGDSGNHGQLDQRIQCRSASPQRVTDPYAGETAGFDTAGLIGHPGEQPVVRLCGGVETDHGADFHGRPPVVGDMSGSLLRSADSLPQIQPSVKRQPGFDVVYSSGSVVNSNG